MLVYEQLKCYCKLCSLSLKRVNKWFTLCAKHCGFLDCAPTALDPKFQSVCVHNKVRYTVIIHSSYMQVTECVHDYKCSLSFEIQCWQSTVMMYMYSTSLLKLLDVMSYTKLLLPQWDIGPSTVTRALVALFIMLAVLFNSWYNYIITNIIPWEGYRSSITVCTYSNHFLLFVHAYTCPH